MGNEQFGNNLRGGEHASRARGRIPLLEDQRLCGGKLASETWSEI